MSFRARRAIRLPASSVMLPRRGRIVLVGDSNVGNWPPALDSGLKAAGYRLAVFAFASCPTPDLTYPSPSYGTLTGTLLTECNQWHQTVTNAISALHPLAVIAASGSTYLKVLSDQQWISGFTKLFDDSTVGNPSAVRILMGTSPFPAPSPNCLAATSNPSDVRLLLHPRVRVSVLCLCEAGRTHSCGVECHVDTHVPLVLPCRHLLPRGIQLSRLCRY